MLKEIDRQHLAKIYELAKEARKPPKALPALLEPTWAALVAKGETVLDSAVFIPGDSKDAVQKISLASADGATLYLTIEPSASYLRLAPVTESIRKLDVRRVVIGAEDPASRNRGKGIQTLEKYGVEVILANGQEARDCQLLYEDYAKSANKSLPILRLLWELSPDPEDDIRFDLAPYKKKNPLLSDALLVRASMLSKSDRVLSMEPWLIVLDPEGILDNSYTWISENPQQVLAFVPEGTICKISGVRSFSVPMRENGLDLAIVLRAAREMGIFSVLCKEDEKLFKDAIAAGLVDSVVSFVGAKHASPEMLSRLSRARVHIGDQSEPLQLYSARLIQKKEEDLWVEAEVQKQ